MRAETIRKLDRLAAASVAGLKTEVELGLATRENAAEALRGVKYPTQVEIVKALFRSDIRRARKLGAGSSGFFRELENISKTTEQFDYLAAATAARHRRAMRSDREYRAAWETLFPPEPA